MAQQDGTTAGPGSGTPQGPAQTSGAQSATPSTPINLKWIGALGGLFIGLTAAAEMGLARLAAAVAALIAFSVLLVWGVPIAASVTKAVS